MHASLLTQDGQLALFGDPVTVFPAIRIAAKKADQAVETWYVSHPFRTYPVIHSGVSKLGETAGPGGGYPVISDAGLFSSLGVAYSASGALTRFVNSPFGSFELLNTIPIVPDPHHTGNGGSGLIPLGLQMTFGSGITGKLNPVIVSSTSGIDMYTTYAEAQGDGGGFRRIDSTASLVGPGLKRRAPFGIPMAGAADSGNVYGLPPSGGTRVDMSHGNEKDTMFLYYMTHNDIGLQTINKVSCWMQRESTSPSLETRFEFSTLPHFTSGVRSFAPATYNHCGGDLNVGYWKNFKAVRHPSRPGEGVNKQELICTVGAAPVYPSGFNLVIWNYDDSVAGTESFHYPVYKMEYVQTSGDNVSFIDATEGVYRTLRVTNAFRAFDNRNNADAQLGHGSSMTLKFTKPILLTRVEIEGFGVSSSNRFPGARISGSFDGTNWNYLHTMSSGFNTNSIQLDASRPVSSATEERIDPWLARYLKFDFIQDQKKIFTHNLTEMRLFGPGQMKGALSYTDADPYLVSYTTIRPEASRNTQRFNTTREGELPSSDWESYGNFTWGVRASGSWSRTTSYPHYPYPQNGLVGSGIWEGDSNGNGDGFSLKPNDDTPPNTSGVVEVNIHVYSGETSRVSGIEDERTISFDWRQDFVDSEDRVDLYTLPFGGSPTLIRRFTTPNTDWQTYNFNVGLGHQTIQWVYTRGATSGTNLTIGSYWIDNIVGLNGPQQPSIGAFIDGEHTPISGVIHGYMNARGYRAIHGYMSGSPLAEQINGYVDATVLISGSIHGFMDTYKDSAIHGYMNGVGTEVFSSIYGVMNSGVPQSGSRIYGVLTGEGDSNRIHGFLLNDGQQVSAINGYMNGLDSDYRIHGFLFAEGIQVDSINGFMPANNCNGTIYGFMSYNPNSGPSGGGPYSWINGYMNGNDGNHFIHGYLEGPPGGFGAINGYLLGGVGDSSIHGILTCATLASGSIHGYMNGGVGSEEIYGYLYGVSGIIGSQINGVLTGVIAESGYIYGFLIGIPLEDNSREACYGHGSIPLPPVTPATIPTYCFNG
jgi:hypothetical protein